jgi:iron complex transport system substrate-binding protein
MKKIVSFLCCVLALTCLWAGGKKESKAAEMPATRVFTDSLGRQVEVPSKITRIAPSGNLAQLVLYGISSDLFVSVAYPWPDTALEFLSPPDVPVTGQFYGKGVLNLESLAVANPEVIIDIGEKKAGIESDLDKVQNQLGIPVIFIEASLGKMDSCYQMIGDLLGREKKASELADYCKNIYTTITEKMKIITAENRKARVIYVLGKQSTNVLSKKSYHAEIIDLLCDNTAVIEVPSNSGNGNPSNLEQFYVWNPDFIIFEPDGAYGTVAADTRWTHLNAITKGYYVEAPAKPYNWIGNPPSINRFMGLIWLAELFYPEDFEFNLFSETQKNYRLFYGVNISKQQFDILVEKSYFK